MVNNISNIIEQAPLGIITFSLDGKIDLVNQNFEKFGILYQLEIPSLMGANIFETDIVFFVCIEVHNSYNTG